MIELEVNWDDHLPDSQSERFTFASKRNRKVTEWLKTTTGKVKRGPIKAQLQTFMFELQEDYDSFLELLADLQS